MSWATLLEREKVADHLREVWNIDDRLLPLGLQTEELLSEWQKIAFLWLIEYAGYTDQPPKVFFKLKINYVLLTYEIFWAGLPP